MGIQADSERAPPRAEKEILIRPRFPGGQVDFDLKGADRVAEIGIFRR
jgi:hypothetical protein